MTAIRDGTVLVTGGAMGMGRLIARRCLSEGAGRVILWDIDAGRLAATAEDLSGMGGSVDTAVVDVSDPQKIEAEAAATLSRTGPVRILFNNAGIVVGKRFEAHSTADIERSIRINVTGVMHVARAFLPAMIEQGEGHIVNIASAAGLVPNPNMSVYAGSKWAVLGWSESLRLELESLGPRLHVTTVCPSYVSTGMFEGARGPLLAPILEPETVVDRIIRAVKRDRILLRTPLSVNLLPPLRGILPARLFDLIVGRGFRIYSSMDRFVGRAGGR